MISNLSVKDVCEIIWQIEDKFDLINKQIEGVYFWKLIRMPLYYKITKKIDLYAQAHDNSNNRFIEKLLYLPKSFMNNYIYGAHKRENQRDYLIFEHPRKVKVNDEYIDKYTHYLIDDFEKNNYEVIDRPYFNNHYNTATENRSYVEKPSFLPMYIYNSIKINKLLLSAKDKELILKIEKELENNFEIDLDLISLILKKVKVFKSKYLYYNKLLKKRSPKKVFLVVSYGNGALIAACKNNNIKTVEIQHGTMSKYHLGYSFPLNNTIPYFPDEMYLFGKYWFDSTPLPIKSKNIFYYGFPYIERRLIGYQNISKKKNQILFISQGVIGKRLAKYALKLAENNDKYHIIFKLHPGEYDRWKTEYSHLVKAEKKSNFEVVDHNDIALYQLFAESKYQIGVFSTAVFEGLTLNCKTILINLPGVEYMEYLVNKRIVKLVENLDELINAISQNEFDQKYDIDYFFNGL
ncbi:sialyltransferase [Halanaerobium saccharolyticum]|uniref:sialyltransferase n=1 Tax=Halanaerobium saccharolyticum TaxID=43595 RepID=UPI003FCD2709